MRSNASAGPPDDLEELACELGTWFDSRRRELPWRATRDPYAIWVSEIMLQQTRVTTVLEYYPRFVRAYPTVQSLARAKLSDVLSAWSGLGYYRRARALHEGARMVDRDLSGRLPADADLLRRIPGVGRYTAGAIASIAFGLKEPVVDGNVARVLSRVFGLRDNVRSSAGQERLWRLATELVPDRNPGRHNQALMELGAMVCTARSPICSQCPIQRRCRAFALGLQRELPLIEKKRPVPEVRLIAVVVRRGSRVLLGKRVEDGLFGGLSEPPMTEAPANGDLVLAVRDLLGLGQVEVEISQRGVHTHTLTHRKLVVSVLAATIPPGCRVVPRPPYEGFAWQNRGALATAALSTLARKVLTMAKIGIPLG